MPGANITRLIGKQRPLLSAPRFSRDVHTHQDQPRRSGNLHIETLRGIAVILMVAGHVIGASADVGMRVDDASIWRSCYDSLLFLRMPLFTVLSGAVYAMRPVASGKGRRFLKGKVRRLLVPAIVVGGTFYITQALIPGVNSPPELSEIWHVAVYSYAHFWFLHALMLIFLLIVALELAGAMASFRGWLACAAIAFTAAAANWSPSPIFALDSAIYMLPFFLWGLGIYRFREAFDRRDVTLAMLGITIATVAVRQLTLAGVMQLPIGRQDAITLVAGLAACALLLHVRFRISWLAKIGAFSYGIYLLHVFGTGGSRIVLAKAGITNEVVLFTIGLAAGIAFSIVAELILSKSAIARTLVFGRRFEWIQPRRRDAASQTAAAALARPLQARERAF
jgi:glucan biosynthesis protein C